MRVAIDMDEVLADTHTAKLAAYRMHGFEPGIDEMKGIKLDDLAPEAARVAVDAELQRGMFFANIAPMEGAREALEEIAVEHEVFVATAAMEYPASCAHKIAWLHQHFPMIKTLNFVFCGDKSILRADVLIDDSPRHFEHFEGIGLCFDALHNVGQKAEHRLAHWAEAPDLLRRLAAEKAA